MPSSPRRSGAVVRAVHDSAVGRHPMIQPGHSERSPVARIPRVAVESGGRGVAVRTHVRRWPRTTRCNELAVIVMRDGEPEGRESLIAAVRRMTAFTLVRSGVFGAAAVAAPAAVLFLASGLAWSSDLSGLVAYAAVLAIALAVVAALAWACVRFAELGPTTAVILTTMPFIALTVVTLPISLAVAPHLGLAAVIPVLFWAVQLAVAVLVARAATRRALL